MNKRMTEIFELEQMLREAHIPYEMGRMFDGYFIKVLSNDGDVLCDAICHEYSRGYVEGMLEIMGGLTPAEEECDTVLGYLTAEEVFVRFQYCYEHNTPTYYIDGDVAIDINIADLKTYYNNIEVGDTVTDSLLAAIESAVRHIQELENKIERLHSILEDN